MFRFIRLWPGLLAGAAVVFLIAGSLSLQRHLRARQEERDAVWAGQVVAARVEAAQAHMSRHHWDDALRLLHEALAVEPAVNREEVGALLGRARQGQADSLLEAATTAIRQKDAPQALTLLRDYLGHPQATELQRAASLRSEVDRAVSDAEAVRCLEAMSDSALALFARAGQLPEDGPVRDTGVREIFKDTLRRHLPGEGQKRAARLATEQARSARLRGAPPFMQLMEFVRVTARKHREQKDLAARQEAALVQLFRQLGVTDRQEQARIRAGLQERRAPTDLDASLARKRDETKQAFRRSRSHSRDDDEAFDRLVDQEVEKLLRELKKPQ
jgi:hypothetical protein